MSVTDPKSGARKSRRKAREFALRGLYQWKLAGGAADAIATQLAEEKDFASIDEEHFAALLQGAIAEAPALDALLAPCVERKLEALSPVEYALLLLGALELRSHPEIPYRVVINEAVELAKRYGGTDGHKFVNGVLDKLAARLRALEVGKNNTR